MGGHGHPNPKRAPRARQVGLESKRCTAMSKRTHERCKGWAVVGANVCNSHGGGTPQVQRKAAERIATMRDKLLEALNEAVDAGIVDPAVCVKGVKDFTELVESLEGRVARREEVVLDATAGARDLLTQQLDRLSERSREVRDAERQRQSEDSSEADR